MDPAHLQAHFSVRAVVDDVEDTDDFAWRPVQGRLRPNGTLLQTGIAEEADSSGSSSDGEESSSSGSRQSDSNAGEPARASRRPSLALRSPPGSED